MNELLLSLSFLYFSLSFSVLYPHPLICSDGVMETLEFPDLFLSMISDHSFHPRLSLPVHDDDDEHHFLLLPYFSLFPYL